MDSGVEGRDAGCGLRRGSRGPKEQGWGRVGITQQDWRGDKKRRSQKEKKDSRVKGKEQPRHSSDKGCKGKKRAGEWGRDAPQCVVSRLPLEPSRDESMQGARIEMNGQGQGGKGQTKQSKGEGKHAKASIPTALVAERRQARRVGEVAIVTAKGRRQVMLRSQTPTVNGPMGLPILWGSAQTLSHSMPRAAFSCSRRRGESSVYTTHTKASAAFPPCSEAHYFPLPPRRYAGFCIQGGVCASVVGDHV